MTNIFAALNRRWSDAVLTRSPSDDERAQAARLGALLFGAGGALGLILIPILPPVIARPLAYFIAISSLLCGLIVRLLPWERWSRSTLHLLCPIGLAIITLGGGFVGGSLDYYSLFLPLIFIFAGSVFLPRTSLWLGALGFGLFVLSLSGAQHPRVAPFFILSLVLAVVCGLILARGRQTERRTLSSMRHLLDAAMALGTAANADAVGVLLSPILIRLVDAEAAAVSLLQNGLTVVVGPPLEPAARLRMEALADRATRQSRVVVDAATADVPAAIAVPIPGRDGPLGALITVFRPGQPPADRFSQGMIRLLAAESGRVLDRLTDTASLTELAMTDPLTGLANRSVLDRVLGALQPGDAVVLCDLDHFKAVNDTFGHAAGDRVLVSFAACMSDVARDADTAARYGGEEFSLVLPSSGIDGARQVVARLRANWAHGNPRATFSAGIAVNVFGEAGVRTAERADLALYRAKSGGRDRDELADDAFAPPRLDATVPVARIADRLLRQGEADAAR